MRHKQDDITEEQVHETVSYLFNSDFQLDRLNSDNNQVYKISLPGASYVIKIAGKGRLKHVNNIVKEISCTNVLSALDFPVPNIIYTHANTPFQTRPFFVAPFFESVNSTQMTDKQVYDQYFWEGQFINRLSILKATAITRATFSTLKKQINFHIKNILPPNCSTPFFLDSRAVSCSRLLRRINRAQQKLKVLEINNAYLQNSLSNLSRFVWANKHDLKIGQWQAGEVLTNGTDKLVLDWSEGLCRTFPLRSIWTRVHWLESEAKGHFPTALDGILKGYFENNSYEKERVLYELNLWRALKTAHSIYNQVVVQQRSNYYKERIALYSQDYVV